MLTCLPGRGWVINLKFPVFQRATRAKATKAKISKPKFTGPMLIALVVVAMGGLKLTMTLGESRRLPSDFAQLDSVNNQYQQDIDEINKVQVLPKLEGSWRKAYAIAELTGVEFKPVDETGKADLQHFYSGPLRNWSATVSGKPRAVLSVAKKIQSQVPTFLYDYSISGGIMKLNITVVGT